MAMVASKVNIEKQVNRVGYCQVEMMKNAPDGSPLMTIHHSWGASILYNLTDDWISQNRHWLREALYVMMQQSSKITISQMYRPSEILRRDAAPFVIPATLISSLTSRLNDIFATYDTWRFVAVLSDCNEFERQIASFYHK